MAENIGPFLAEAAIFILAAFLVAWLANIFICILRGEHSYDTADLWWDTVLRMFNELGIIVILKELAPKAWPLRVIYWLATIGIIAAIFGKCRN